MPSRDRRAAGRRRAWGRGPVIVRFEPLEDRRLLSTFEVIGSGLNSTSSGSTAADVGSTTSATTTTTTATPASTGTISGGTSTAAAAVTAIASQIGSAASAGVASSTAATTTSTTTTTTTPPSVPIPAASTTTTAATPTSAAAGKPDLIAGRVGAPANLDWNETFPLSGSIRNQGNGATTAAFLVDVYASPATQVVRGAVKLGTVTVPAGIGAGQSYDFTQWFTTPPSAVVNTAKQPSYYLVMAVDADSAVAEGNEANNANLGLQGVDAAMVTYTPRVPPKLVAAGLKIDPTQLDWGGTMTVTTTLRNDSTGNAPPTNARIVLAPAGEDPYGSRGYTVGRVPMPAVLGNQTVSATQQIRLPANPPTALAGVGEFRAWMISDADEVADPVIRPQRVQGQGLDWVGLRLTPRAAAVAPTQLPDLKLASIENPASIAWGESVPVKAKVENNGSSNAGPFKVRFFLTQGTGSTTTTMSLGDVTVPSLQAQYVQDVMQTITLPANPPAGFSANGTPGVIVAQVDPDRSLDESSTTNNVLSSPPITLRVVGTDGSTTPILTTTAPANVTPTTTAATKAITPTIQQPATTTTTTTTAAATPATTAAATRAARLAALKVRTAVTPRAPRTKVVVQRPVRANPPKLRVYPQANAAAARAVRPLLRAKATPPAAGSTTPGAAQNA